MARTCLGSRAARQLRDASGTIVIKFALLAPTMLVVIGSSVDYAVVTSQKAKLQAATDAASIAAAKEIGLADFKGENVQSIAKAVVEKYLEENHASTFGNGEVVVSASISADPLEVDVTAVQSLQSPVGEAFGLNYNQISVNAVARVVGRPNVCVLGLDPEAMGTISLEQNALVTGKSCAVFSNSTHTSAIKAKNSATLTANLICSRGGKSGGPGNFSPEPLTDCPSFEDPLADRPEPNVETCLYENRVVAAETVTLEPGTYCGGLVINDTSKVNLRPGIYVIKDGPLEVSGNASIEGEGVGFFFTGPGAKFSFLADSSISLTAPEEGPMAGLLMFEARNQVEDVHRIQSNDARKLIGTLYLPQSELRVDADSPVADQSAYTAIVARSMRLYGGPHLVLNTNYNLTPVPVPDGIKGADQPVTLVK